MDVIAFLIEVGVGFMIGVAAILSLNKLLSLLLVNCAARKTAPRFGCAIRI